MFQMSAPNPGVSAYARLQEDAVEVQRRTSTQRLGAGDPTAPPEMAGRAPAADLAAELDAKLNGLCAVAQSSLDETWAEIGTSAEEERAAIARLKEQLTAAFLSALTRETGARPRGREDAEPRARTHRCSAQARSRTHTNGFPARSHHLCAARARSARSLRR